MYKTLNNEVSNYRVTTSKILDAVLWFPSICVNIIVWACENRDYLHMNFGLF